MSIIVRRRQIILMVSRFTAAAKSRTNDLALSSDIDREPYQIPPVMAITMPGTCRSC